MDSDHTAAEQIITPFTCTETCTIAGKGPCLDSPSACAVDEAEYPYLDALNRDPECRVSQDEAADTGDATDPWLGYGTRIDPAGAQDMLNLDRAAIFSTDFRLEFGFDGGYQRVSELPPQLWAGLRSLRGLPSSPSLGAMRCPPVLPFARPTGDGGAASATDEGADPA